MLSASLGTHGRTVGAAGVQRSRRSCAGGDPTSVLLTSAEPVSHARRTSVTCPTPSPQSPTPHFDSPAMPIASSSSRKPPLRVAIIGGGPSGLVTAKTLLDGASRWREEGFEVEVSLFEQEKEVGGTFRAYVRRADGRLES